MKKLTLFSIFLAAVVIILGAYTRLTDAGLGCPDWPGCYGNLTVPLSEEKVAQANAAYPERPVEAFKAWNEMIHRYFAGTLGLCVLAIAIIAVRQRHKGTPVKLPLLLLGLIIFQAALGMWTVTLNLLPVVVMGHLLGGFSVLSCLFVLYLRLRNRTYEAYHLGLNNVLIEKAASDTSQKANSFQSSLKLVAFIGAGVLITQIALGGGPLLTTPHLRAQRCLFVRVVGKTVSISPEPLAFLMHKTMNLALMIMVSESLCILFIG